jgi:Uma2 family endonuclease
MNLPPTMPWPTEAPPEPPDTGALMEFIDGQWRPKHPPFPPPLHDREGCEYVDDTWVEKPASFKSGRVGIKLLRRLESFLETSPIGVSQWPEMGYQCFPDAPKQVRKPDVSFIRIERMTKEVWDSGNSPIAPDFAAEVISPNEEAEDVNRKVQEYLAVGVRLVWVIYPKTKTVWIFRLSGTGAWVAGAAELSGEDVIPGFTISLETLFSEA